MCDEGDVLARELLLQLPHQAGLDLLESLQLGHRHEHNDGLLVVRAINLLSCSDVKLPELGLEVAADLQVQEGLADTLLDLIRLFAPGFDDLASRKSHVLSLVEVNQAII